MVLTQPYCDTDQCYSKGLCMENRSLQPPAIAFLLMKKIKQELNSLMVDHLKQINMIFEADLNDLYDRLSEYIMSLVCSSSISQNIPTFISTYYFCISL